MRDLQWLTESVARSRVIAHVLLEGARPYSVSALADALSLPRTAVQREVSRLLAAGFLRGVAYQGRRSATLYEVVPDQPGLTELRRFVQLSVGEAALIRETIREVSPRSLAWIIGPYAQGAVASGRIFLVVLTDDRRRIEEKLAELKARMPLFTIKTEFMTPKEWTYRLERREFRALRLRRAQRMWLLGSDGVLRALEESEISARRTLKAALANWREELSDEWDEDWDPFEPFKAPT